MDIDIYRMDNDINSKYENGKKKKKKKKKLSMPEARLTWSLLDR
jgi:hypothetical protein